MSMQPVPGAEPTTTWLERHRGASEMGRRAAEVDWAATPLGPPEAWPIALRVAVGICLTSQFPMLVVWGPDLIKIYNDAYAVILGTEKHPRALGAPAKEIWPEIWDVVGPLFEQVMTTGESTWREDQRLHVDRNGYLEEAYFTYSYSPIPDDDGAIGGVLDTVTETTGLIIAQRRLAAFAALSAQLVAGGQITDLCVRAVAAIARFPDDVTSTEVHLRAGEELVLVAATHRAPADMTPRATLQEIDSLTGATVLDDAWTEGRPARRVALPIGDVATGGVLVVGLSEARPFDHDYRAFVELLAGTLGTAVENAYRRSVELGEQRHISDTLQNAMMLPASDIPTVAARYLPAVGNLSVGGDWYDVIALPDGRRGLVVGDCVGHGLDAATAMGQLRSASRALLYEGRTPAEVLEAMDRFAASVPGASCATMVCAVVDTAAGRIDYAAAGHPPPLVVRSGSATWLDGGRGLPLAVEPLPREGASADLGPDDVLVLYTDGLVERRGEDIDIGLARLRDAALRTRDDAVHDIADALLRELLDPEGRDDVAVVVKRMAPPA
ncbi:MAG TPA: PP2C family protein-serine/threonine phosphatase [Aquihabitans sp.]|jgi:hypothetical protein|nr:PP2C family protein-serine/threonine phosphatase [Aquihabitans sp.]